MKLKILLPFLLILLLAASGCYLLKTAVNPNTGKEETKLETVLNKVNDTIGTAAPIVNTFVPGVGTIAGGVGALLTLIGGLVTSVVVAKRRGGALEAVIKGVQLASDEDTKNKIKEVSGALGVEPYLKKIYKGYFPTTTSKT